MVFSYLEKCSAGNTDKNCCSASHKCGENQGDCDNDSHCKSGLKCGKDNCPAGFPSAFYDCCYNPKEPGKNALLYQIVYFPHYKTFINFNQISQKWSWMPKKVSKCWT